MSDFSTPPTRKQVEEAIQRIREHAVDPEQQIDCDGDTIAIKDLPSPTLRQLAGIGHGPLTGRMVHQHPYKAEGDNWPWMPDKCLIAGQQLTWLWLDGGESLTCPGCGIDGT